MNLISPDEDSPDLTDSDIESSVPIQTEREFMLEVFSIRCPCGQPFYIQQAKQLLRKPHRYCRVNLRCLHYQHNQQLTYRFDYLRGYNVEEVKNVMQ